MAYAYVQSKDNDSVNTGENSIATGAFGANLTAGNLMICLVWYDGAAQRTVTLSGGGSPTWNQETVVGAGPWMHSFYALNVPGGTTAQVSASFSNVVNFPAIFVAEYSGFKTSGARLGWNGQNQATPGTGTDGLSSGLLGALAEQPAGIIGFSQNESTDSTPAAGTSFNSRATAWDYGTATPGARLEDRRVTALDSVAALFTAGTNVQHKTVGWAFSEAAGASAPLRAFFTGALTGIGSAGRFFKDRLQ